MALILEPWRNAGRAATHVELLKSFSKNGYCVEGRHICSLLTESSGIYSLRSRAIIEAVAWRPITKPWLQDHDDDCPDTSSGAGLWCHWLAQPLGLIQDQTYLLKIFALLGADVNQSIHDGKKGRLLEVIISRLPQNPYFICKMFFDVAMQTGRADVKSLKDLLASIKPTPNSTLDHSAESSGRRKGARSTGLSLAMTLSSKKLFMR